MCGIAGFTWNDETLIRRMTQTLRHRGPDQSGIYTDEVVSLGHRRLSVIDLSEQGRQPMSNEDGSVWVTYNGEIYNFAEIRRTLRDRGHRFRNRTDSEVIVHAYEQWGLECVQRFNGIFAFALWDRARRQLWLVRDRRGSSHCTTRWCSRPDGEQLVFASEMKAILECTAVDRSIDLLTVPNRPADFDTLSQPTWVIHHKPHRRPWLNERAPLQAYFELPRRPDVQTVHVNYYQPGPAKTSPGAATHRLSSVASPTAQRAPAAASPTGLMSEGARASGRR